VVIAILTTITVISYQNVMKQSYNAQISAGVRSYYDAIKAYKLAKGTYPSTTKEENGEHIAMTCVGTGYEDGYCGKVTGVDVYEDALFNTQIKSFLKTNTGPISDIWLPVPGESYVGAAYGIDTTIKSSTGYGRVIEYAMHGENVDCGVAAAWAYSTTPEATACEILLEEISF